MGSRIDVFLEVHHDAALCKQLTDVLGFAPDVSWDVGAPFVSLGNERRRRSSRWAIFERVEDVADISDTIDRLIERVKDIKQRFAELPKGSLVGLQIAVTTSDTVFGIGANEAQLKFLADIGAYFDVGIVVHADRGADGT